MKNTRTVRIAAGTVCLIVVALVMGWFVGRYIPGDPREPEPRIGDGLYSETGYGLSKIVDFDPGSTMKLRNITQGQRYVRHPDEVERTPSELVDFYKENGEWEYECPDIDLSVSEIKTITTKGFAEWYPEYAGTYRPVYDDSELIAVTVTITNASDNLIQQWYKLPLEHVTLWSENLDYIDDSLGAGVVLDDAFVFAIPFAPIGARRVPDADPAVQSQQERLERPKLVRRARSLRLLHPDGRFLKQYRLPSLAVGALLPPGPQRIIARKTRLSRWSVFFGR